MLYRLLQASRGLTRRHLNQTISFRRSPQNVSQVSYFASVASGPQGMQEDAVIQTAARFTRLNGYFQKPATVNSDHVMEDIRSLIQDDIKVPLSYYMDAVSMFTTRRDILRTELVLHMCKKNIGESIKDEAAGSVLPHSTSRSAQDPFHKAVAFAVSDLIARGATEEAMRLWVRMASAGFVTNSYTMQQILRRLAFAPTIHNLELFNKIHAMVVTRSWHHLPGYLESYLCVMRQHLKWACSSLEDVRADMSRVEHEWEHVAVEVVQDGGALTRITMLHALKLQCLLNAEAACRKLPGAEAQQAAEEYADRALEGFKHLIQTRAADDEEGGDVLVVREIARMFKQQANSFDSKAIAGMHAAQNPKSHDSQSKGASQPLEHNPAARASETVASKGKSTPEAKQQHYMPAQTAGVAVRAVVNDLVLSLCKRGLSAQVVELLRTYLQHLHLGDSDTEEDSSVARARFRSPRSGSSATRPSAVSNKKAPLRYTESDAGFARFLMEEAMQNIRFPSVTGSEEQRRSTRYALTTEFVSKLEAMSADSKLPLRENFVGRRIMHAAQCLEPTDWKAFESLADTIIDSSDDAVGRSPYVTSFLVNALAVEFKDPNAVKRAHQRVKDIMAEARYRERKGKILPSTWVSLLNGATQTLEDEDLAVLLREAEKGIFSAKATIENTSVLTARLYAHARLGHGYQSLTLLSRLRWMHSAGDDSPTRYLYTHVINALYHAWPGKEKEWHLAKSATSSIDYLLQSLSRDGVAASQGTIAALLKLYTKQAQILQAQDPEEAKAVLKQANKFLIKMAKGGHAGHGKVPVGSEAVRELVKMACILGSEQEALQILREAEKTYSMNLDATAWEPLVYYLAVVRGALNAAEDVLTLMTNATLKPTDGCVDSVVRGFLQARDAHEALERLEELHNLTGARPAPSTMLILLENAFKAADKYEAQRVASVILRLFSEEERQQQVVGFSTRARALGKTYAEEERKLLIDRLESAKAKTDLEIEEEAQVNVQAFSDGGLTAPAQEQGDEDVAANKVAHTSTTQRYGTAFANKEYAGDQYRLREGGGGGKVLHAPLSRAALEGRFAEAGFEMPKY